MSNLFKPDPHAPVSADELAAIVASHDHLQAWNDRIEQALKSVGDHPDSQVLKNIHSTAALIVQNGRSVSSQNFELMRALNLYDQTLSPIEMAAGFVEGGVKKMLDKASQATAFTEPGDMNIQRSHARVDKLLDAPQELAEAAKTILLHPEMIPDHLHQAIHTQITDARHTLASTMIETHPSYAMGAVMGGAVTGLLIDRFNTAGKLVSLASKVEKAAPMPDEWQAYATLLGGGMHPPRPKPIRDFSEWMKLESPMFKGGQTHLTYDAGESQKINLAVLPKSGMTFMINTVEDREKYGTGTEVFLSAVKKLHNNGVDINQIRGDWTDGDLGTNWQQFMSAYHAGATLEQASKQTFTGRMAERLGLTTVDVSRVSWALETEYSTLYPIFKRPDWGSEPAWNDYANAWVLAQGRPGLELTRSVKISDVAPSPSSLPAKLLEEVEKLPETQRQVVVRQLQENFSNHATASATRIQTPQDTEIGR